MGLLPLGVTFAVAPGRKAVWGFPLHAELIVGVHGDEAAIGVAHASALDAGGLGITLRDGDGRILHEAAAPEPDPEHLSFFPVRSEEPCRVFVDASPLLPRGLSDAEILEVWTAEIWLATMAGPALSNRIQMGFRLPAETAAEPDLLLRTGARGFGFSWGQWTVSRPEGPTPLAEAMSQEHPLFYNAMLQHLFFADLQDIDPRVLDGQTGPYADEANLWRAELLWLSGDTTGFEAMATKLASITPLLAPGLEAVRRGNGLLTTWRGLVKGL